MTNKEWAELEPGVVLSYDKFTYRTVSKDEYGRWLVEKLNTFNVPLGVVSLNVDDKRVKHFKIIKDHIASAAVQQKLQRAERRGVN